MLEKGKITPAQLDKVKAKDAAKERYKKGKEKMTKTEMQEILDVLLS